MLSFLLICLNSKPALSTCSCIKENMVLIKRAFTADFVIPEFRNFCNQIQKIYDQCKDNNGGQVGQLDYFICCINYMLHHHNTALYAAR